jgi:hypothetical protein
VPILANLGSLPPMAITDLIVVLMLLAVAVIILAGARPTYL